MKNVFSVIRNLSLKIKHARHKEQGGSYPQTQKRVCHRCKIQQEQNT